jgi:hypothetical protein
MIEEDLKKLRLTAPAEALRDRILTAAGAARRWQVIDRGIAGSAAAAIALALYVGLVTNGTSESRRIDPEAERLAAEIGAPELAGVFHRAMIPPRPTPWRFLDDLP